MAHGRGARASRRSTWIPELKPVQLSKLPVKIPNKENENEIELYRKLEEKVKIIEQDWVKLISMKQDLLELLQAKYVIEQPNKLHNWNEMVFGEFLKELKRQNVKLNINEEAELIQYFKEQKEKVQNLKSEIDIIDSEIDQIVYKLYGLTREEIIFIEESI